MVLVYPMQSIVLYLCPWKPFTELWYVTSKNTIILTFKLLRKCVLLIGCWMIFLCEITCKAHLKNYRNKNIINIACFLFKEFELGKMINFYLSISRRLLKKCAIYTISYFLKSNLQSTSFILQNHKK